MRIISRKTLKTFWAAHRQSERALRTWFHQTKLARWNSFQDIKHAFPTADIRPNNRIIFNIKGNTYRLIAKIHFNTGIVFIRFVGTHAEYDRINPDTV